ncbi:MAG: SRPBCC family protein [Rhizomicrobium sp.]
MDTFGRLVDPHTVSFERLLPGPLDKIWSYLADGGKRGEWFASGPLPANLGERFQLYFDHKTLSPHQAPPPERFRDTDKNGFVSNNTLLAYEPMRRLAFSFGEESPPPSEVEFVLRPEGDKVRLILTHRRIPTLAYAVDVSGGWHSHLSILEYKANNQVPPAFWDVWRQTEHSYDRRYE